MNLFAVNVELFGWVTGSLLLLITFGMLGRLRGFDYMMLLAVVAIMAGHFFYWFSGGPDFGARYWFLTIVPLAALAARALSSFGHAVNSTAALLCLITLVTFVPWRAIDKYHNFRGLRPGIERLTAANSFGRSLVLVKGKGPGVIVSPGCARDARSSSDDIGPLSAPCALHLNDGEPLIVVGADYARSSM